MQKYERETVFNEIAGENICEIRISAQTWWWSRSAFWNLFEMICSEHLNLFEIILPVRMWGRRRPASPLFSFTSPIPTSSQTDRTHCSKKTFLKNVWQSRSNVMSGFSRDYKSIFYRSHSLEYLKKEEGWSVNCLHINIQGMFFYSPPALSPNRFPEPTK